MRVDISPPVGRAARLITELAAFHVHVPDAETIKITLGFEKGPHYPNKKRYFGR